MRDMSFGMLTYIEDILYFYRKELVILRRCICEWLELQVWTCREKSVLKRIDVTFTESEDQNRMKFFPKRGLIRILESET